MQPNREGWLTELAKKIEPLFVGIKVRPYRITCGWPSVYALSGKRRRVGECHGAETSAGGLNELFVSPTLEKPMEVAGVVCHELVHVVAGVKAAHGREFLRFARHVGLTKGPPTSMMPGPRLIKSLEKIVPALGPYPHSAIRPTPKIVSKTTPTVTLECECGCRITISKKWLDSPGPPVCGCGKPMAVPEPEDE